MAEAVADGMQPQRNVLEPQTNPPHHRRRSGMHSRNLSRTRWLWAVPLALCLMLAVSGEALAAGTPAGTVIRNIATANYQDVNGNALPPVQSNEVTTVVSQVAGTDVSPETSTKNTTTGGSTVFYIQVTNTGNGSDSYSLALSGVPSGWSATLYRDLNGNGILEADERTAGNQVSSVSLAADLMAPVLMEVTSPSGAADGQSASITVTATSQFNGAVSDAGTYTATVTAAVLTVNKTASPTNPRPGEVVTYAIQGANNGTATAYNVVITDLLPSGVTYLPGSIRFGPGTDITYAAASPLTDAADGDTGEFSEGTTIVVRWGDTPSGQTGAVFFRATVSSGLGAGTTVSNFAAIAYESPQGTPAPTYNSTPGLFTVTVQAVVSLTIPTTAGSGESGSSLSYPITVTNNGNSLDVLDVTTASSGGFPNKIWVDANGDGIAGNDGDYLLADTDGDGMPDTGNLTPGATLKLIVVVSIPPGTPDGTVDATTLTVTSSSDPTVSAAGTVTTAARSPIIAVLKSVSPTGAQPPGQVLTYTAVVSNSGQGIAANLVFSDPIPARTTYVPNSVTVNGNARTDAADGDNVVVSNQNVVVTIGMLGPGGSYTIQFSMSID